jgi:hypothetical protein
MSPVNLNLEFLKPINFEVGNLYDKGRRRAKSDELNLV